MRATATAALLDPGCRKPTRHFCGWANTPSGHPMAEAAMIFAKSRRFICVPRCVGHHIFSTLSGNKLWLRKRSRCPRRVKSCRDGAVGSCPVYPCWRPECGHPGSAAFAKKRHGVYSMTSSAWASNEAGTVKLSALAVLMLIESSTCVGCSIGKSAGSEPARILLI